MYDHVRVPGRLVFENVFAVPWAELPQYNPPTSHWLVLSFVSSRPRLGAIPQIGSSLSTYHVLNLTWDEYAHVNDCDRYGLRSVRLQIHRSEYCRQQRVHVIDGRLRGGLRSLSLLIESELLQRMEICYRRVKTHGNRF